MIYQFLVTLNDAQPLIWRRFRVDENITFNQLHMTVQFIMGWENRHLYRFTIENKTITELDPDMGRRNKSEVSSRKVRLNEFFTQEGQQAVYLYDFGDDWRHTIVLEKILPKEADQKLPVCLEGEGHCPMEDSGGVRGVLFTESRELVQFQIEEINQLLRKKAYQLNQYQAKNPAKSRTKAKRLKLTKAQLKKQLQSLSHPELVQLLVESYSFSKQMEQLLTVRLMGEEAVYELFASYKKKIKVEFFPDRGNAKLRLTEAIQSIDDFGKITQSNKFTFELMLYFVEMSVKFINEFGYRNISFNNHLLNIFISAVDILNEDEGLMFYAEYEERISELVSKLDGIGWGFEEHMYDIYAGIRWLNET